MSKPQLHLVCVTRPVKEALSARMHKYALNQLMGLCLDVRINKLKLSLSVQFGKLAYTRVKLQLILEMVGDRPGKSDNHPRYYG